MTTKPATITLGISGRIGSKSSSSNQKNSVSFAARPTHITQSSPTLAKRGHIRSASLENGNSFTAKNTLGLPAVEGAQQQQPSAIMNHNTGTLKSRNEQKRMRGQKFGSYSSLDQDAIPGAGRTKFQNIRQIFEITKKRTFGGGGGTTTATKTAAGKVSASGTIDSSTADATGSGSDNQLMHSLPPVTTPAIASTTPALMSTSMPSLQLRQQTQQQPHQQQQQQQQQLHIGYQQHTQLVRKPTPTLMGGNGSGNRNSYSEMSERLSISESVGGGGAGVGGNALDVKQKLRLQQQLQQQQQLVQQQQQLQQHLQAQRQHSQPSMGQQAHPLQQQQQQQQQKQHLQTQLQLQQLQQQQMRSSAGMPHLPHISAATGGQTATTMNGSAAGGGGGSVETGEQPKVTAAIATATPTTTTAVTPTMSMMTSYENLLRPIAFKPIPFEPDYSIQNNRYVASELAVAATASASASAAVVGDRYGSTPSLAAAQGSNNMRFGSTSDLRHGGAGVGGTCGSVGSVGGGVATGGIAVGAYSSNNYCNSLMARRRGSRSLKINDSMESIRHTPDSSDVNSQSSTIKSTGSNNNHINNNTNGLNSNGFGGANGYGCIGVGSTAGGGGNSSGSNGCAGGKYLLSEQCDMTPSPSDSGISDLEAALKDRDSELSYLRQTMEHNEKVIFRVQKDKENFWEQETKRLKTFYEAQQREYLLKMKKMEQMLAMQQFQFKQHKLRHTEQSNKLREQVADFKNENEILRSTNSSLKNSERNLKDSVAYIEEQLRESENTIAGIRAQLEESEWKVCERNGELALLKSQLKEANVEITLKEHAIVHLRHENTNAETQIYESLQENQKMTKQQKQVEQQQARTDKQSETELKQLNKIIILKDQVILALTNELAKLRKELSDLAIFQEYGEEPSGRFIRLKQQLDNLTDICNRTRRQAHKSDMSAAASKEKVIDDTNLELIMNCLKIAPPLDDTDESENEREQTKQLCAEKRLAKMSADIQNFVYGAQNLPDIAVNHNHHKPLKYSHSNPHKLEESTLDTLIEESASYAEEIGKLRKQLDDVRVNFELEKRQWCEEREKVLNYQKQLQAHYINMYQKLRSLESSNEV
ncbi:dual specificity protein kinase splA isoform X1 [Anastrepha obliqua]|uniref:dual specificity protein kinase splA isoform X1 n=1 Tax=Anastrepha obliqua TaxID=95512 RepID=UPI00240A1642|nr:dual specificity protein kinase splA isoform X1 [Anastrepha obliqua]